MNHHVEVVVVKILGSSPSLPQFDLQWPVSGIAQRIWPKLFRWFISAALFCSSHL